MGCLLPHERTTKRCSLKMVECVAVVHRHAGFGTDTLGKRFTPFNPAHLLLRRMQRASSSKRNTMTTITIERELLERAAALLNPDRSPSALFHQRRDCAEAIRAALSAPATAPEQPAWHDAPTVPGLWWVAGTAGIFHIDEAALPIYKGSAHRWFGPIPPDSGDKP